MIPNYSDPIVTLNQVYRALQAGTSQVLGACIIGPNYLIRDYQGFGEKLRLDSDEIYPIISYNNTFSYESGLSSRPLPARETDDSSYLDVNVLVKNAKLCYEEFTGSSSLVEFVTYNDYIDQLSINKQQDSDSVLQPVLFKDNDPESVDIYSVGDQVVITLKDANDVSFTQTCLITGFLKDNDTGNFSKCVLSKRVKNSATDTITKVAFFHRADCYVDADSLVRSNPVMIKPHPKSALMSLVGEPVHNYDIYGGAFYAEYRTFSKKYSQAFGQLSSVDLVEDALGKISDKNPLGIAVASALKQAEGSFVYFVALDKDPSTLDETQLVKTYNRAAAVVAGIDGIHGIVPCTDNNAVLTALLAYVEQQSAEQVPYFKYLYGSANISDKRLIVEEALVSSVVPSNGTTTITLGDSSLLTATQTFTKGDFIGYGNGLFAQLQTSDHRNTITTKTPGFPTNVTKIALYKSIEDSPEEIVDTLIENKKIKNKRCSIVFADGAMYAGAIAVDNYCTAAALAGRRSVSQPHAPLSNIKLTAITCAETHHITKKLSDKLGAEGFWRVGTDENGDCISKRQLTSMASGDVNYDEQSIVTNIDSICLDLKTTGRAYVGNTNISGALLDILQNLLNNKLDKYKTYTNALLGPQLLSGRLISVIQDPVYKDRIYASMEGEPPKPFNKFHITFYML